MTGFLLDTNVVSELMAPVPDSRVDRFLEGRNDLWLSALVLHELEFGVQLLPLGRRRDLLRRYLSGIESEYRERTLPITRAEARTSARLRWRAHRSGRVLHVADALIAATAAVQELTLVTRNVRDFEGLGVPVVNPWRTDA